MTGASLHDDQPEQGRSDEIAPVDIVATKVRPVEMSLFPDIKPDRPVGPILTALSLGCWKHDQIVHHAGSGPGGHNIFDPKRARRHHSYLIVFRKAVDNRHAK